jgi:hypothetical protein
VNQLCLPINVGVLIPPDDSVRLLVFVLKRLDLTPLYEAYNACCEKRRKEQTGREREALVNRGITTENASGVIEMDTGIW